MPSRPADTERLRSLLEIGRAFASTLDRDSLLSLILDKATALVGAERSTLFLMGAGGRELWSKIAQGEERREIRIQLGEGLAGWVAQTGQPLRVENAYEDPRFRAEVDRMTGYHTRSVLCVPLRDMNGRTTGVIEVLNQARGAFSEEDEEMLLALGGHAATALENARLYESLRERVRELDCLVEMEREASSAEDGDLLLSQLLRRAIELVGAEAGSIVLLDPTSALLHFRSTAGPVAEQVRKRRLRRGEGIAGWVAARGEPAWVNQPNDDPRHFADLAQELSFPARNILCVPFFGDAGPAGAVELINKLPAGLGFGEGDARLLTLIAAQVGRVVGLAETRATRLNESRLATIGQTLAGILHDLRTPMTVISGYAQLMAEPKDSGSRTEQALEISRQCDRMNAMVREVLAYARGDSQVLVRKAHLGPFLTTVAQDLRADLGGHGVDIDVQAQFRGEAWFDEEKMRRLIHNLARNAAEAMAGGGRFAISAMREDESVDGRNKGHTLVLTFSDTGAGIPPELDGHVFEPFRTSKKTGTGLGLAIVDKIVKEHRGSITYHSQPGAGTTFTVRLPQEPRNL